MDQFQVFDDVMFLTLNVSLDGVDEVLAVLLVEALASLEKK